MLKKSLIALALVAAVTAQAQTPAAPAAAASPAKKELVGRILKFQQPAIEGVARNLVEQPAMELMQDVSRALPVRVAKDKQEQVAKDIQADVRKYLDDAVPMVQKRAVAIAPTTVGAVLEKEFSDEELRQLAAMLESPVYGKFQRVSEEMHKSLADKLVADTRGQIEPKVRALEETVGKRLGMTPPTAAAPQGGAARPAGKPASK